MAAPNDDSKGEKDDDDVGALIYRESQLRKAEAAAAATETKETSKTASSHHRASARKRSLVKNQGGESLYSPQCSGATKRKRESSLEDDRPSKKVTERKYRHECPTDGCTNRPSEEVCAKDTEQRLNISYATPKDAQAMPRKGECV